MAQIKLQERKSYQFSCILLFLSIWWSGSWGFPHVSRTVKKLEKLDDQGDKLSTSVFNSTDQLIRTTLSTKSTNLKAITQNMESMKPPVTPIKELQMKRMINTSLRSRNSRQMNYPFIIYGGCSPYGNSGPWMNPYYPGAQRASNNPLATVLNGIAATTPFLFLIQKYLEQLHG
ncbi:uncharacterized protein LOC110853501 [Folsomia candida]|uniref:Uncharacterized protein n=1 Tax=Folsomia candida TaxID=158441 RepID=A0A226F0I9_FOLCA|nr:uncharacterized protein LOC110853501 [Folsomia candida]OXA63303.1 hypothetical protein Fcan01_00850 [Folsomia candida]